MPELVRAPAALEALFGIDPEVHLYGLADLEEPYWSQSAWWLDGEAAVGLIRFPGSDVTTAYAMSQRAPWATMELLAELVSDMPSGTLVTGPVGLAARIRRERAVEDLGPHIRMIHDRRRIEPSPDVERLGPADLDDLVALHATDPGSAFFMPHMLHNGLFVGARVDGRLVASAGTHVLSDRQRVAAVGAVVTDPEVRGMGWGSAVSATLVSLLARRGPAIGLNVAESNRVALQLYESIGFERRFTYEEIELR
jgi:ribosomal protein S18 acetylase RimI-like enzyme